MLLYEPYVQCAQAVQASHWKSTCDGEFPRHGKRSLIIVEGTYYYATYNARKNCFKVEDELMELLFRVSESQIMWTEAD